MDTPRAVLKKKKEGTYLLIFRLCGTKQLPSLYTGLIFLRGCLK